MPWIKKLFSFLIPNTEQPVKMVIRFALGSIIFFVGLMMVILTPKILPASLILELIVLSGLLCIAVGGLLSLIAQIQLVIYRLFYSHDKDQ